MLGGDISNPISCIVVCDVIGPIITPNYTWKIGRFVARKRDRFCRFITGHPTRRSFSLGVMARTIHDRMRGCWSVGLIPEEVNTQWIREILDDHFLPLSDYIHPGEIENLPNSKQCPTLILTRESIEFQHRMRAKYEEIRRYISVADFYLGLDAFLTRHVG